MQRDLQSLQERWGIVIVLDVNYRFQVFGCRFQVFGYRLLVTSFRFMATFKSFEDIEAWQKARVLSNKIFILSLEGTFSKDYKLKDQINGSSGSIMDNIAEGFERDGKNEFRQFLSIAKASAGETRSQLYRLLDRNHITKEIFDQLVSEVVSVSKQISGLITYLNRSEYKGTKFNTNPKPST